MPVYWINADTSWMTNTGTAATTVTTPIYSSWITTNTVTATATSSAIAAWYYVDIAANDSSSTITWTQPARRISPARLYIARRSHSQALADDLHDHYLMEQSRQRDLQRQHDEAARARSLELLLAHLSPAQRETFERNKWFVVEGGKSKQRYRIRDAGHMVANIDVLALEKLPEPPFHKEVVKHRLCGHCDLSAVPLFDQLLAQKMMLEFDEERFLSLANRHQAVAA